MADSNVNATTTARFTTPTGAVIQFSSPLKVFGRFRGEQIKRCIVAVHGYGDNAQDFLSLASEIESKDTLWVAPQGLTNVPMLATGYQWYDLFGSNRSTPIRDQIEKARVALTETIGNIARATELPLSKIALAGFSQGAFIALHTALRMPNRLGATVALSGYLNQSHRLSLPLPDTLRSMPIFVGHGMQDQVVLPIMHFETLDILEFLGFNNVTAKQYPLGHNIDGRVAHDVTRFLENSL